MSAFKSVVRTGGAPRALARYSQGIRAGNTLYVQGMIALDPATGKLVEGGIAAQTRRVFESIRAVVAEAGMTMADIVKVTAFLADLNDYAEFNKVYDACFTADPPPVRTTVQAAMPRGALVEVEVIACAKKEN
jgi:2-iminobutanoate/2-iminopropanoate deaminase